METLCHAVSTLALWMDTTALAFKSRRIHSIHDMTHIIEECMPEGGRVEDVWIIDEDGTGCWEENTSDAPLGKIKTCHHVTVERNDVTVSASVEYLRSNGENHLLCNHVKIGALEFELT